MTETILKSQKIEIRLGKLTEKTTAKTTNKDGMKTSNKIMKETRK